MATPIAIIDLGTNTFHLLIQEAGAPRQSPPLFQLSRAAKIGKGGINQGVITPDGIERAVGVLRAFREKLDAFGVPPESVYAFGTSAIRNAKNQEEFCQHIEKETGIRIRVLSGDQEAQYIFEGVRASGAMPEGTASLIVDIGGGSVEFIIATPQTTYWKQSFEIGGQRLMEWFMRHDPISPAELRRLFAFLDEQLIPLTNAVHQYAPTVLVGSSGSFDTLLDMDYMERTGQWPPREQSSFELSLERFRYFYEQLRTLDKAQRTALPGMIELRVDMIVVAVCLIDLLCTRYKLTALHISTFSLKEGVLSTLLAD